MNYILGIIILIVLIYLQNRFYNYYFSKPDVHTRRIAKAKLRGWIKFVDFLIMITILVTLLICTFSFVYSRGFIHSENTILDDFRGIFIFFVIIPISLILTNTISWLIPSIRAIEKKNFEGVPGASYKESNIGLLKFLGVVLPVLILLFLV